MSFIVNVYENDTLKYWNRKLKGKWYRIPFLITKKKEIDAFESAMEKIELKELVYHDFNISHVDNNININSKIVVIIPAYIASKNSLKQLNRLLKSLNNQSKKPYKVIVIDDCSPISYPIPSFIEFIKLNKNSGPATARNIGIERGLELNADIFAFTDSDVITNLNWVESIHKEFVNRRNAHALSGKTISYNKTWLGKYHNINGTLNGRKFKNSELLLYGPTCNFSVVKEAVLNLRFSTDFPKAASEDIEFCFKLLNLNFNIFFSQSIIIYHDYGYKLFKCKKNMDSFKKQFVRYAKGEKILLEKIPNYYSYLSKTEEICNFDL